MNHPDAAPDLDFEPGEFAHLVAGNTGRLLDARRTPVSVLGIRKKDGMFLLQIDDFEDRGDVWEIPFEDVRHYEFRRESERAAPRQIRALTRIAKEFDRRIVIDVDPDQRRATDWALGRQRDDATAWLARHSEFLARGHDLPDPDELRGCPHLARDLTAYMAVGGLEEMEREFARTFVHCPHSGEIVKGHALVLARMGLVPYDGKIMRDPTCFEGAWHPARRAVHIQRRLAFVRALFGHLDLEEVQLFRRRSPLGPLDPARRESFVSSSFSRAITSHHSDDERTEAPGGLMAREIPVSRLFMTFYETDAMNQQFLEAEATLLADRSDPAF